MDTKTVVLYHKNCLDGFAAAYAAWHKFGSTAEYIAVNYNEPVPLDVTDKDVFIVDFSYSREILLGIRAKTRLLRVIDHHAPAAKEIEDLEFVIFDKNKAGCILAWEYFHGTDSIPELFTRIQDRDLWKFEYADTNAICRALNDVYNKDFETWRWLLDDAACLMLAKVGQILIQTFNRDIESLLATKHQVSINNEVGLACNASSKYKSELGGVLANLSQTYGLVYWYNGERKLWEFALRSGKNFDVAALARQFGGNGHVAAAGFVGDISLLQYI